MTTDFLLCCIKAVKAFYSLSQGTDEDNAVVDGDGENAIRIF